MVGVVPAEQIVGQSPDGLILVDDAGRIVYANGAVTTLFGYADADLLGRSIEQLVPERAQAMHHRYRQAFMAAPATREMGARVVALSARRHDGTEFPAEIRLAPIEVDGLHYVVAAVRDVTERRRMIEEVRTARAEADRANRTKSRFLATASHDLRQPLQTLQLLNAALARHVTESGGVAIVQRQEEALEVMGNLLNALLDITKLESGTLQPNLEDVPVGDVMADLQRQFQDVAKARDLALTVESGAGSIRTDRVLLRQMLQNLLSNGLQYTRTGTVGMRSYTSDARLIIDVTDTGVGIPKAQQEKIFEEYYRIEQPGLSRRGFGLGLTIVRQIANLLGYEVSVESEEGRGTTFHIAIPLSDRVDPGLSPAHAHAESETSLLAKPAVLIVEDDNAVREALQLVLTLEGYPVYAADSAEAAKALFEREGYRIDLVVTDFQLGSPINGLRLLEQLRAAAKRDLPAVILTGEVSPDFDLLAAIPRAVLLRKPTDARQLIQSMEGLFGAVVE